MINKEKVLNTIKYLKKAIVEYQWQINEIEIRKSKTEINFRYYEQVLKEGENEKSN